MQVFFANGKKLAMNGRKIAYIGNKIDLPDNVGQVFVIVIIFCT